MALADLIPATEPPCSADETAWHERWMAMAATAEGSNATLAGLGGALADRLAWVFMSGYQAAVRQCFPEFAGVGWSCYAAAEADDGPGCVIEETTDGWRLSGAKSWVAGAEHVERLVVVVDVAQPDRRFVLVERQAPGVTVTNPRQPKFLAEMTQGAATFEQVAIPSLQHMAEPDRLYWFRAAEPLFVLLSLNGCLAAHARSQGNESVADQALAAFEQGAPLAEALADRQRIKPGIAALRATTRGVVAAFAQETLAASSAALQHSWRVDGPLLVQFGVADRESSS